MSSLTLRQKQYIWLAGSHPELVVRQGRGYRTRDLLYGIDDDAGDLFIFGYSSPLLFLAGRGLFRKLQDQRGHVLTEAGEAEFRRLLVKQEGLRLNQSIRKAQLKGRTP